MDKFIIAYYYKSVHLSPAPMNTNVSDICPKCGACFFNKLLYWAGTGKRGDPVDLASFVCRPYGDNTCINPMRNVEGGDTWANRASFPFINSEV